MCVARMKREGVPQSTLDEEYPPALAMEKVYMGVGGRVGNMGDWVRGISDTRPWGRADMPSWMRKTRLESDPS